MGALALASRATKEDGMTVANQLKELNDKRNAKADALKAIFDEAGPEMDMDKVKSLSGDSKAKVEEIRKLNEELDEVGEEIDGLKGLQAAAKKALERGEEETETGSEADEAKDLKDRKPLDVGKAFVDSVAFKDYQPGSGKGPVARLDIDLKTLFETGAGWDPEATRTGVLSTYPTRPAPHVVDFIPQFPTKQKAVVYMEETTLTNNAVEKAEGSVFGEAALALTERTKTIRKIPVFLPVTDEQLEDVDEAEAYVKQRLVFMLQQRLDLQVLQGTGVAPLLEGTENVSGIQTQALGADPIPDAVYKGMVLIRTDGFADPGVVFITAGNWQDVRLLRTADGIYIWGSPSDTGPMRIWGVNVVETQAAPSTKAIIGDYAAHSALYNRRGIDIQVSNSHGSYFVEGKQAVRADVRVAMVHYRPKAFCAVTGL